MRRKLASITASLAIVGGALAVSACTPQDVCGYLSNSPIDCAAEVGLGGQRDLQSDQVHEVMINGDVSDARRTSCINSAQTIGNDWFRQVMTGACSRLGNGGRGGSGYTNSVWNFYTQQWGWG